MANDKITLFDTTTKLVDYTLDTEKQIVVHQGGTSSSKTWSLLQVCFMRAIEEPGSIITVVGQDVPNLKKGAYRDALNILKGNELLEDALEHHYRKERELRFVGGSLIEFHSYDDPQDAKSGKRDYLFINEADGISWPLFDELNVRTEKQSYIDFNPTAKFWAHEKLKGRHDVRWIRSTFQHNPYAGEAIVEKIKSYEPTEENIRKGTANKYRWKVYGLGEPGRREGLVFPGWKLVDKDDIPEGRKLYGLDFGYSNDPTALVEVTNTENARYYRSLIYETGLTLDELSAKIKRFGLTAVNIVADSAEPRSIETLRRDGIRIRAVKKGRDSINAGIIKMKEKHIYVPRDDRPLKEEFGGYAWQMNHDGNPTNKPIDKFNDGIDASRYAVLEHDRHRPIEVFAV